MNIEALNLQSMPQTQLRDNVERIDAGRKKAEAAEAAEQEDSNQVQPEELLNQIKSLTEDGVYSVRFENDNEAGELVVKVVDRDTDEVIRQIPPEELLDLTKRLNDLRGNLVDTQS